MVSDIFSKDMGFCLSTGFPFLISIRDDFSGFGTTGYISSEFQLYAMTCETDLWMKLHVHLAGKN